MRAEILCVGSELLIGQIVNTNATWIAQQLAGLGIDCYWMTTVGDNFGRLDTALKTARERSDLVILTGGLGPTVDDITVEALARLIGEPLVERAEAREHVETVFARRKRQLVASNYKQALFPPSGTLIPNPPGTAMGVAVTSGGTEYWAFPGVPMELHAMWREWAAPKLSARQGGVIRSTLLKYASIGESALAEQVARFFEGTNPTVAPYASHGEVHLRVTAKADSPEAAERLMAPVVAELSAIAPYYYGRDDETLPSAVGRLLTSRGETVAVAESCTGGLLASRLTDVPGATRYMVGGIVAYIERVKAAHLGVPEALMIQGGCVNRAVAEFLALGARERLGADWGIGTTGWASPGPEVPEGDAGLVWMAVAGPNGELVSLERRFGERTPREQVKYNATQAALDLLRMQLAPSPENA